MQYKVFIDGQEGTTGLKIFERFANRDDIELLRIDDSLRKDTRERQRLINESDYTFLCLPDSAAIEAVSLLTNDHTRIIDASTAHRTDPNWAYGFPELSKEHRQKIKTARFVAVPGCYASGMLSLTYPLIKHGIISADFPLICHAVSGYSGGGRKMIEQYEGDNRTAELDSPRQYALAQNHKHLKEMQAISGLNFKPMFNPIVDNYFNGMVVTVPLIVRTLEKKVAPQELLSVFQKHYDGERFVKVMPFMGEGILENGFLAANTLADTNDMQIFICGNDEQILLASRFDNLGKGASGAAVQCMDIMCGKPL